MSDTREIGQIFKDLLNEDQVRLNIFHRVQVINTEKRMNFYLNEFCYTYHNENFRYKTAYNFITELHFKHHGFTDEQIKAKNVEEMRKHVNSRLKNWAASSYLERFLPDGKMKTISCNENGDYKVGIFYNDDLKFSAMGSSIAEAKRKVALLVMYDSNRFNDEYCKWLLGKKRVHSSFVKPQKKIYSDPRWAVVSFFKKNYFNLKTPNFWKQSVIELEEADRDFEEKKYQAALFIRKINHSKQMAAKDCIRAIKNIINQDEWIENNKRKNYNKIFTEWHQKEMNSGRGKKFDAWGNSIQGQVSSNYRNQWNYGIMNPQQYQIMYRVVFFKLFFGFMDLASWSSQN